MDIKESSAVLREARRLSGLTQRDLADRAGTSQPAIARIESGIARQLATARRLLDDYFDHELGVDEMEELERACADLPYWEAPAR